MAKEGQGVVLALFAAASFGLVNVAARGLPFHPLLLTGITYLLAGVALAPFLRGFRADRVDFVRILAMSLVGGAVAPTLLFLGLHRTSASSASLILTLEMVFTTILAAAFLGERARGRSLAGLALLFFASAIVAWTSAQGDAGTSLLGAILVASAALGWGIDNTLSARLVGSYKPHHILAVKGIVGGGSALAIALVLRASLDAGPSAWARVAFIGLVGIAASVLLFYHALQRIGATRTSALFLPMTALAGVSGAALFLGERLLPQHAVAMLLVAAGVWLLHSQSPKP